jgi:hypothetical protein
LEGTLGGGNGSASELDAMSTPVTPEKQRWSMACSLLWGIFFFAEVQPKLLLKAEQV